MSMSLVRVLPTSGILDNIKYITEQKENKIKVKKSVIEKERKGNKYPDSLIREIRSCSEVLRMTTQEIVDKYNNMPARYIKHVLDGSYRGKVK